MTTARAAGALHLAPGLDYPGVGPEHSYLKDTGRAHTSPATDDEALDAFDVLSRVEGIIPALEAPTPLAYSMSERAAAEIDKGSIVVTAFPAGAIRMFTIVCRIHGPGAV